jgi:hypothetical protein
MEALDLMYSPQAVLCALVLVMATQALKASLDLLMGGAEVRKGKRWTGYALRVAPVLLGAGYGAAVPFLPESIEAADAPIVAVLWGAAVGPFSAYVYDSIRSAIKRKR